MGQAANEHQTDRQTNRAVMMGRKNQRQTDRQRVKEPLGPAFEDVRVTSASTDPLFSFSFII